MTSATPDPEPGAGVEELRFRIHGRVQGVGFRWWARTEARRLGLSGSVRNVRDGTVEIHARGGADSMERFAEILRRGPPAAEVQRVDREPASGASRDGFEITH